MSKRSESADNTWGTFEPKKLRNYLDVRLVLNNWEFGVFEDKPYARLSLLEPMSGEVIEVNSSNKMVMEALHSKNAVTDCPAKVVFYLQGRSICVKGWSEQGE